MGMSRDSYSDYLGVILEDAVENWDGLHGIDLHGPENLPAQEWTPKLWDKARVNGRVLKAHAGEFGPARKCEMGSGETRSKKNSARNPWIFG